jgi:hypothetical protein
MAKIARRIIIISSFSRLIYVHFFMMFSSCFWRRRATTSAASKLFRDDGKIRKRERSSIGERAHTFIMLNSFFRWISIGLAVVALAAGASLLVSDAKIWSPPGISAAVISAAPLLLIGISFLFMQPIIRPRSAELVKNMLLAGTFLLWGAIQLMPQNHLAERLGSIVIVLYVVDLAWTNFASMNSRKGS